MKYLGLDLGTRTIGVSISDNTKTIATTYDTIHFEEEDYNEAISDNEKKLISECDTIIDAEKLDVTSLFQSVLTPGNYVKGSAVSLSYSFADVTSKKADNNKNLDKKRAIAKKAVRLLKDGDVIFLDISTTNLEVAKEIIKSGLKVKVVSHMLGIADLFAQEQKEGLDFIMLGGMLNYSQNSMLGALTVKMLETFRFDCCFLGVVGADISANEISTYLSEDGVMKSSAVLRSNNVYLVMEKQKFDFKGNYVYAKFDDVDGVICEEKPSKEIEKALEEYRVELI